MSLGREGTLSHVREGSWQQDREGRGAGGGMERGGLGRWTGRWGQLGGRGWGQGETAE